MHEPQPAHRLTALSIIIAVLVGVLTVRLWQLQVLQGAYYLQLSEDNRVRDYALTAPRGVIYDRRGRPLVTNRPSFTVAVLPLEMRAPAEVLPRLAALLDVPLREIQDKIDAGAQRPFEPVRIRRDVGQSAVTRVEENRLDLPGVVILVEPVRSYLHGKIVAHVLGHLGEVSERQLTELRDAGYKPGDLIGKDGVERAYEGVLRGTDGRLRVEVDAMGRPLRVLSRVAPSPGRSIVLTIDLDLQKAAYDALRKSGHRSGAVVALDPRNGDVLAMVSLPAYDPNQFAIGISAKAWKMVTADPLHPLLNRASGAAFEPGSVFKLVTATAALQEGIATRSSVFYAPGFFRLGRWVWRDLGVWGNVNFITGIANSINVVFYTLGYRLGGERLAAYARLMGLGQRTGIDLPGEVSGTIPSPSTKQQLVGEPWYPGDAVNMSIGQGAVTITPLQAARLMAFVANNGRLLQPRLLLMVTERDGRTQRMPAVVLSTAHFAAATFATLHEGLLAVVERGTGRASRIEGLLVGGKTGSAENPRGKPHAWFAGYAPADHPRLVLVAFVEHGYRGGRTAAPIVRAVLTTAFPNVVPQESAP
ncbi:MAG TPA: penicillin-binding protein 2 [bacterium]|jgi:penicillin-binding protein 2